MSTISKRYSLNNKQIHVLKLPGVDYAPAAGTPIRAVADGVLYRGCTDTILGAGYSNAYGYMAIIEHEGGLQSLYGHMQAGPDGGACNYGYFQF